MYVIQNLNYTDIIKSKSAHGFRVKTNLLFWNMNTGKTRKELPEKVQIDATVEDCNLRTPQETMCQKEIYETLMQ